jgi:flagellar hook-associated protein 3 FlgL
MSGRVSSYSGPMQMDSLIQTMTSRLNQIANEIASGQKTNPAGSLGTSASLLYQLHIQTDQATALQTSMGVASQRLDTVQTVLSSIASVTEAVSGAGHDAQLNGTGNISAGEATTLAQQAQSAIDQMLGQLNTTFAGSQLFAGDSTDAPMQASGAAGGATATMNAILTAAVAANGGNPLASADIANLVNGPNGIASVFSNTNGDPAQNFNGVFYTASASAQPTTVLVGANQTLQYNTQANQPAFRDLLQGLSMLSMAGAPSSQLDGSARSQLVTQGLQVLSSAQTKLTEMQGSLGNIQAQMQNAVSIQQAAATATQHQLAGYEQADITADATNVSALQTQLQAAYELTAQISQLSLTRYMPNPA